MQDSDETSFDATRSQVPGRSVPGQVIGPYTLFELIGEGGMGEVWLAEQKKPVRRRVAIKLIKAGMDTQEVVARFESERQALALMDHPNIAKVFDAGSTPDGRPYFVMEYVAGLPITVYCDKHKLTTKQRLELFVHVCEGVQHAHQKAIIHRDLKPSNVLVSEVDGKPLPRIIDFGVAKATSQRLTEHTMYTHVGAIIGTLEYMSPEQADSAGRDIDTRTDVYSLGVVLYELLVGALPLDFRKLAFDQALKLLREEDAPKPSTRLRTLGAISTKTAQDRGVDPPTLARQLHGDADAIVMKSVEKDRGRRYATPLELSADIERLLHHEPVKARPASAAYRVRKYVRRHGLGVSVAGFLVVLLVGFVVMQAAQLRRIKRERERADRITRFMTDMFKVSDPSEARGNSITAREILDKASRQIDTGLASDSDAQAQMSYVMAGVYDGLGLYNRSEQLARQAMEARLRTVGPEDRSTLISMNQLALELHHEGHEDEAEKLQLAALATERRVLKPNDPVCVEALLTLAGISGERGRYAEDEKLSREAFEISRQTNGPDSKEVMIAERGLGYALKSQGHYPEAEHHLRSALEIARHQLGSDDPETLRVMANLAAILEDEHQLSDAEKLMRQTLDIQRRVLGPEHPRTAESMGQLASILQNEKRGAEAEQLLRQTLELELRLFGAEDRRSLATATTLANLLLGQNRYADAEPLLRQSLETSRRALGPEHPQTLQTMMNLGNVLMESGHFSDAEKLFRHALESQTKNLGKDHPNTALTTYNLACVAAHQGHKDEAFSFLHQAIDHGLPAYGDLGMDKDPDLNALHSDPRWPTTIAHAKESAAGSRKNK
jgi:non-specific serine/threonine protein kinase/serine/threonine-protein kinase